MRESGNGGCGGYYQGNYGGDPISGYLPPYCPCRDCCYRYSSHYSGGNGGGGPDYQLLMVEALENVNRSLSALGAFIENITVSLGVEVKGSESPSNREDGLGRG
jgi:hypothetical protein